MRFYWTRSRSPKIKVVARRQGALQQRQANITGCSGNHCELKWLLRR